MPATYYEVLIKGSPELIRGFMIGFEEGKGTRGELVFEEHCRVEEDSPLELLYHILTIHHDRTTIIVEAGFHDLLFKAIETRRREVPVEIQSVREITRAGFAFRFRTFSPEEGKAIRELFSNLADGVRLQEGYAPEEKIMPDGHGVEVYAPLHRYEMNGKGEAFGSVREIYDLYCKAGCHEVIEVGKLKLVYGKKIL
jgi:hypothetical protein